jgi:hypothetical protein
MAAMIIVALISISAFAVYGTVAEAKTTAKPPTRLQQLKNFATRYSFGRSMFSTGFATIQSVQSNNSRQVFYLQIRSSGYPTIITAQLNATVDPSADYVNKTENWVAGLLNVRQLIEYTDNDGNGIYTPKNDTALQTVNLSALNWILREDQITSTSGYSGYNITLMASYKNATFEVITQVYNTGVKLSNGIPISPSEVKLDFIFDNFPWISNSSRLALVSVFGGISGSLSVTHVDNQTDAIEYKQGYAYFTWASTATVDGKTVNVTSYQGKNSALHVVELNFPHGSSITDDPILGVGTGSVKNAPSLASATGSSSTITTTSAAGLPGLYFMVATAVVVLGAAAMALFARKRMVEPKLQY